MFVASITKYVDLIYTPLYSRSESGAVLINLGMYRVFIKYCVFFQYLKIFRTLALLCFPSVSVCVHAPCRQNTIAAAKLAEFRKITKF